MGTQNWGWCSCIFDKVQPKPFMNLFLISGQQTDLAIVPMVPVVPMQFNGAITDWSQQWIFRNFMTNQILVLEFGQQFARETAGGENKEKPQRNQHVCRWYYVALGNMKEPGSLIGFLWWLAVLIILKTNHINITDKNNAANTQSSSCSNCVF